MHYVSALCLAFTPLPSYIGAPPATATELLGDFDHEDMKGITVMPVDKMVEVAITGIKNDTYEIHRGQSNQLDPASSSRQMGPSAGW